MILNDGNPIYWFRSINVLNQLIREEPDAIEWLKIETGECFIHTFGTAFWKNNGFRVVDLAACGITHWRVKERGYSERVHSEDLKRYSKHMMGARRS